MIVLCIIATGQTQVNPDLVNLPDNTWKMINCNFTPQYINFGGFNHPKSESSMTFDEKNGLVIWFGGCSQGYSNCMWVYSVTDNLWTQHNGMSSESETRPKGQCHFTITYDSDAQVALKYTGISNGGPDPYTWSYDAALRKWTKLYNSGSGNRSIQGLAYDRHHKKTILFGKWGGNGCCGTQTYAFDMPAKTWTNLNPANHPASRGWAAMDFHQAARKVVLFGGGEMSGPVYGDTWTYDYATNKWEKISTSGSPGGRIHGNMAYDPNNKVMILFGGYSGSYGRKDGSSLNDTWVLNLEQKRWTRMNPGNPPASSKVFKPAFDPLNNVMIITRKAPQYKIETWAYRYKKAAVTNVQGLQATDEKSAFNIFPSPVQQNALITFKNGKSSNSQLKVYNSRGRMVKDLSGNIQNNTVVFNTLDLPAGVYVIKLRTGKDIHSKKVMLLR
jgi:hypothetical protein